MAENSSALPKAGAEPQGEAHESRIRQTHPQIRPCKPKPQGNGATIFGFKE
jgi:hypothetical protein